ncbi:MAG: pseudaminic acid synthase [Campylobacterales bacterium]|nr:pseudaminic acid synthase [Campylobacterales bacterium]
MNSFAINGRKIGKGYPAYIVAELSANHGNDINIAIESIKVAKEIGADAVKIQTYTHDTLTIDCDNEYFQIHQNTLWDGESLYSLYKKAYMPWEWQPTLKEFADSIGITLFSTPFDKSAVDFLEDLKMPAYKIASFEIFDLELIKYTASKQKPMIISTGVATLEDIEDAINACKSVGNEQIALLKCTSSYPAQLEEMNLATIKDMGERFNCIAGLSDHSFGVVAPIVATTFGASIIEKHFMIDKSIGGADSGFSLDKREFELLVKSVRNAEKSIGKVKYELNPKAEISRELFGRSLFVVKDIKAGDIFDSENIRSIRPGFGIKPKYLNDILGKQAKIDLKRGTPMKLEYVK